MSLGLIVRSGRILTAKLLLGQTAEGITHCAIGEGDGSFSDPISPPNPDINQTALKGERARKRYYKRTFLKEDPAGVLIVNGVHYLETGEETNIIGVFFRFEEEEANGITIREYGFFGGGVTYRPGITSAYAAEGVYHPNTNPAARCSRAATSMKSKTSPISTKSPTHASSWSESSRSEAGTPQDLKTNRSDHA
jgi:hypothetical protein